MGSLLMVVLFAAAVLAVVPGGAAALACAPQRQEQPSDSQDGLSWRIVLASRPAWIALGFAAGAASGLALLAVAISAIAHWTHLDDGIGGDAMLVEACLLVFFPVLAVELRRRARSEWIELQVKSDGIRLVQPGRPERRLPWTTVRGVEAEGVSLVLRRVDGDVRILARNAAPATVARAARELESARTRARRPRRSGEANFFGE